MAGLAGTTVWRVNTEIVWPSMATLGVCLAVALLFQPYWIGALGAIFAAVAERFIPRVLAVRDDNWIVVAASLAVMGGLAQMSVMR